MLELEGTKGFITRPTLFTDEKMGCWVSDAFKGHPKMDGSKPSSGFKLGFKPGCVDPWLAAFLVYHITQPGNARFHLKGDMVSWIPSHYQMILQKTMSLFFQT